MKFIFEVRVKPGFTVEEYAQGWVEASEIIQQTPGARGTYLHRKIGHPDTVLAIAHWDSKAHRDAKDDSRSEKVKSDPGETRQGLRSHGDWRIRRA